MYTQCPKCSTAFRVTAEVLRQAAGKVRCGGCSNAFNALEHLSEEKPESRPEAPGPESPLPELTPDPAEPAGSASPTRISAEQSAALLKTLDELAGSDIRLEDTGIEWRLLDDDDAGEPEPAPLDHEFAAPQASLLDAELSADLESRRVDEVLSSSPTPVDELLTAAGDAVVESPEVFDAAASKTIPDEELRFDDNTGLPDDYDAEEHGEPQVVIPEPSQDAPEPMANLQVDLSFDDPDEWQDLLEEVGPDDDPAASARTEMTLAEELDAIDVSDVEDDLEHDEALPAGDELASQMEALSLELTGIQEELDDLADEDAEPSIIDELAAIEIDTEAPDDDALSAIEVAADEPDDENIVVETAAATDNSATALDDGEDDDDDEAGPRAAELPEEAAAIEIEAASIGDDELPDGDAGPHARPPEDEAGADAGFDFSVLEAGADLEAIETQDDDLDVEEVDTGGEADDAVAAAADIEFTLDDDTDAVTLAPDDQDAETSIDDDLFAAAFETEAGMGHGEPAEPVVEPLSEEEQTINMMIDQDLLSIAVTDDDGAAATIVGAKELFDAALADAEAESEAEKQALVAASLPPDAIVETIIMSGDGAKSVDEAARAEALKEEAAAMIAASKAEEAQRQKQPLNRRMVAGVAALALLLAAQAIHFSRDALARVPVIHDILAPIYDTIGMPLAPAWEVTGWRVEKTKGSVDASGETLNIYTEIGNLAGAAMPYPVIGVSLLDRFEESIGSRIFEPGEYLAGNVDRLALVGEGQRFSAEMTIESPAVAASGFRLNVCYRQSGSQLRCALEDFR